MAITTDQVTIRPGRKTDMTRICELVKQLAKYEKAEEEMWLSENDYLQYFDESHFETIVAEINGRICGMMLYYPTFSTWKGPMLHLEDFIIDKDYRRHGIGKKLMSAFLSIAKEQKVKLVRWEVLDWNTPAIEFYKKYDVIFDKDWWNVKILMSAKPESH